MREALEDEGDKETVLDGLFLPQAFNTCTECTKEEFVRQLPCCQHKPGAASCLELGQEVPSPEEEFDTKQNTSVKNYCELSLDDARRRLTCRNDSVAHHDSELGFDDDGSSINIEGGDHLCRLCQRRFPTARALGGHLRSHGSLSPDDGTSCDNIVDGVDEEQAFGSSGVHCSSLYADTGASHPLPVFFPKSIGSFSLQSLEDLIKDSGSTRPGGQHQRMRHEEKECSAKSSTEVREAQGEEEVVSTKVPDISPCANAGGLPQVSTHSCEVCEKMFESAAELELHRKVHPQYGLRSNPKRSRRFIDQDYTFDEATSSVPLKKTASIFSEKARACTECGKEFSSWKALFGHMRCHPEREWRGIQPPENISKQGSGSSSMPLPRRRKKPSSNNTTTANPVTPVVSLCESQPCCEPEQKEADGTKILSDDESDTESIEAAYMNGSMHPSFHGWMTGKRSKRPRQFVRSSPDAYQRASEVTPATTLTEIKEEQDMANCLVMLACAGRSLRQRSTDQHQPKESTCVDIIHGSQPDTKEPLEASTGATCPNWNGRPALPPMKYEKEIEKDLDGGSLCEENDEDDDGLDSSAGGCRLKYECTTCKRIFKSHQALGGHRASHKKVKGCFARTNMGTGPPDMQEDGVSEEFLKSKELFSTFELQDTSQSDDGRDSYLVKEESEEIVSVARKLKGHECSICHRVFTSGQALGGHKRCHWGGAGSSSELTAVVSSNTKQTVLQMSQARTSAEKVLDLNLPAAGEDTDCVRDLGPLTPPHANRLASASSLASAERTIGFLVHRKTRTGLDILEGETKSQEEDEELNLYSTEDCVASHQGDEMVETSMTRGQDGMDVTVKTNFMEDGMEFSCARYLRCNICDRLFTSMEAFCNHRKTHACIMASVPGLTPISA